MSYRPICDVWICVRPKVPYHGAYPAGFLERARMLLGVTINDPVLHVCSGMIRDYQSGPMKGKGLGVNDCTLDLNADLNPNFLLDARRIGIAPGDVFPYWTETKSDSGKIIRNVGQFKCEADGEGAFAYGVRQPWAACLIDRPYDEENAQVYADKYGGPGPAELPDINDLLRRALSITRIGGRVGVLDYVFPRPPRDHVKLIALIAVSTGWNQRARWFSVFERLAHNPLEHNVTGQPPEDEELPEGEEALDVMPTDNETGHQFPEDAVVPPGSYVMADEGQHRPPPTGNRAKKKAAKKAAKKKAGNRAKKKRRRSKTSRDLG